MKKILALLLALAFLLSLCACSAEENETATLEETRAEEKKTEEKTEETKTEEEVFNHKADVTNIREKLNAIPVVDPSMSTDQLRQICIDFMKLSVSFQWIPDRAFSYDGTKETTFSQGKLYGGIPYVSAASGNLYRWLEYYDDATGVVNCEAISNSPMLFSNACSGGAGWAWYRVINTATISYTHSMNVAHGFVIVGDYTYDTSIETMWVKNSDGTRTYKYKASDVCKKNGKQVMFESYAKSLPADCFSSNGHVRMSIEAPVVVRNEDGTINGEQSYVMLAEQGLYNSGESHTRYTADGTSYQIRGNDGGKWTFDALFNDGYLIHTFKEFLGLDPAEKSEASITTSGSAASAAALTADTLTANYPISDIFTVVKDANGVEKLKYTKRMTNHFTFSASLKNCLPTAYLSTYGKSGDHTIEISALLSTGATITVYSGTLSPS